MYPTVGFFSHGEKKHRKRKPRAKIEQVRDSETLIRFDSGRALSFEQGRRSVIVIGGTGAGKTASAMLPMASNLIKSGMGGLILDVKGNLREQARAIARAHGREDDIIEFGSAPNACRCNILDGMTEHETSELMNVLATSGVEDDKNIAWHQRGAKICADVAKALTGFTKDFPAFSPTLLKIFTLVTNKTLALGLWTMHGAALQSEIDRLDREGKEHPDYVSDAALFRAHVDGEYFHVLKQTGWRMGTTRDMTQYEQNLSWNLDRIVRSFRLMQETHGILERFSCDDERSVRLDLDDLIYAKKKIVLVHFAMDSGFAGALISKAIKERFYLSVMKNGLGKKARTFMLGDEFQDIIDVSGETRVNDAHFFALSREFGNVNVIATQSIASLLAQGERNSVTSLLANCTARIILQCSDPATLDWISTFRDDWRDAKTLKRGRCLLECVNADGDNVSVTDALNAEYAKTSEIVAGSFECKEETEAEDHPKIGKSGFPIAIEETLMNAASPTVRTSALMVEHAKTLMDIMRKMSVENLPWWIEAERRKYAKKLGMGEEWGMSWAHREAYMKQQDEEDMTEPE